MHAPVHHHPGDAGRTCLRAAFRHSLIGLLAFWAVVAWAVSAHADEASDAVGIGETVIAQLNYCTSEDSIAGIAAIAAEQGEEAAQAALAGDASCAAADDPIIFTPIEVIDTFAVKGNPDVAAFLVRLQLEGIINEKGSPMFYEAAQRMTLFAIAFRQKPGEAI